MYLKDSLEYIDHYDRMTVEHCRSHKRWFDVAFNELNPKDPEYELKREANRTALRISLYFITGEEAMKKQEVISEWMERDRQLDLIEEQAQPRTGIKCLRCSSEMNFLDKSLDSIERGKESVIMFYDCPKGCVPRRAFYDNGEEWLRRPIQCKKCGGDVSEKSKREMNRVITTYACSSCGNVETDTYEFLKLEEPHIDETYAEDRVKYCLDEKGLKEYRDGKRNVEDLKVFMDRHRDEEKNKKVSDAVARVRVLNLARLQEVLSLSLQTKGFVKLDTSNPAKSGFKQIEINFTAQDSESNRSERDAKKIFEETTTASLADTNWRLIKTSIEYNLGLVTGRVKGYQNQSEIKTLLEKEMG